MEHLVGILALAVALVGVAGSGAAHVEVGADTNLDGDCADAGEHLADVPTLELVEGEVCIAA